MTQQDAFSKSQLGQVLILAVFATLYMTPPSGATSVTPGQDKASDFVALQNVAMTFPQPVRVGDLAGRYVLMPNEAQGVLGHVASPAVFRAVDGRTSLLIHRGGWLGFGTTQVAVPLEAIALLGEHVVLVGLPATELGALPSAMPDSSTILPPDTVVRMGIIGPFH